MIASCEYQAVEPSGAGGIVGSCRGETDRKTDAGEQDKYNRPKIAIYVHRDPGAVYWTRNTPCILRSIDIVTMFDIVLKSKEFAGLCQVLTCN